MMHGQKLMYSQLSLLFCDLQSVPNYLVVNYPVGTLSVWAYVICVAVLLAHILEVTQSDAYTCAAGFVIFPCFCAGNSGQLRVQRGGTSWRQQQNGEGLCKFLELTGSPCLLLLTRFSLLWVLWIAVWSVVQWSARPGQVICEIIFVCYNFILKR